MEVLILLGLAPYACAMAWHEHVWSEMGAAHRVRTAVNLPEGRNADPKSGFLGRFATSERHVGRMIFPKAMLHYLMRVKSNSINGLRPPAQIAGGPELQNQGAKRQRHKRAK